METCRQFVTPPQASCSPPAQYFTQFTSLPQELRIYIWKFSLPKRRLMEVRFDHETRGFESFQPPPAALSVCSESRAIALEVFTLAFKDKSGVESIAFDYNSDILYLRPVTFSTATFSFSQPGSTSWACREYLNSAGADVISRIKYMAAEAHLLLGGLAKIDEDIDIDEYESYLARFKGLEELYGATNLGFYEKYEGEIEETTEKVVRRIVPKLFVGRYKQCRRPWDQLVAILNEQRIGLEKLKSGDASEIKFWGLEKVNIKGLLITENMRIEWKAEGSYADDVNTGRVV